MKTFKKAEAGFFAMSRDEETLKPTNFYTALPNLKGTVVIIADTMIATGGSILDTIKIIEKYQPKKIIVAGAMFAKYAREKILSYNSKIEIYSCAEDPDLTKKGFISPGLGDAGDRAYGLKMDI